MCNLIGASSVATLPYRSCTLFDKDGSGIHEVSLSPSVSTNATELNLIFSKVLGVGDNLELISSKRKIKAINSNNFDAVKFDAFHFLYKKSINNYWNSCQGVYLIFVIDFCLINCRHVWLQYKNQEWQHKSPCCQISWLPQLI